METRRMDAIGEELSLLGFGMMRLPLNSLEDADIDRKQVDQMVDLALEGGVNYFDSAWLYHAGKSEEVMGASLGRHPRDSYRIATKMPLFVLKTREQVAEIFEEQLRRLGVDHIDYYLAHNITGRRLNTFRECEVYDYLRRMKEQGKIRHLGFSFHDSPQVLQEVVTEWEWDFAQIQLNYLDWELQNAHRQYEVLTGAGLPVVVMEPVRGGVLATLTQEAAAVLKAHNPDASLASWALRYVASLPGVMTVLSGMSNLEQVRDNLSTFSPLRPLDAAERGVLGESMKVFQSTGWIPCTGCRYCLPCPEGVSIPEIFDVYNQYKIKRKPREFLNSMRMWGIDKQLDQCVGCGACLDKCPQRLPIPHLLAEVSQAAKQARDPAAV